ncbi:unnamed protein product [Symbiodinium pilosum]|uniref:Nodulin-like domain-containing protein n=1 Tax=Symbiodinium pilosum TaxID=2952 RepID=A0A812NQ76_SYMPI|nr:unnamed protein product [Symbiodinium pilosum]
MSIGTVIGVLPLLGQLDWSVFFPSLDTLTGLKISYAIFGMAEAFFSTIATFAPLEAFPVQYVGAVSAAVQVSTSLGASIQSEVYVLLKANFQNFVPAYYTYMLVCTVVCGGLMVLAFWENSKLLHRSKSNLADDLEVRSLQSSLLSRDFAYMSLLFFVGIGFVFSYLDAAGQINAAAGLPAARATITFGIYGALARVCANCALDYTRGKPYGGPMTYIALSLLSLAAGLAAAGSPSNPDTMSVHVMNFFCSLGAGGLLGVTPPALRLIFGSGSLGLIYGLLYLLTAFGIPTWGFLLPADGCASGCFQTYCRTGAALLPVLALGALVIGSFGLASRGYDYGRPKMPKGWFANFFYPLWEFGHILFVTDRWIAWRLLRHILGITICYIPLNIQMQWNKQMMEEYKKHHEL